MKKTIMSEFDEIRQKTQELNWIIQDRVCPDCENKGWKPVADRTGEVDYEWCGCPASRIKELAL